MKHLNTSLLLASTLLGGGSLSAVEALNLEVDVLADAYYDSYGFDAKEHIEYLTGNSYSDSEFESLYPIFSGSGDYEVFGYGSLEYYFSSFEVMPDFDLSQSYDWEISIAGSWGYIAESIWGDVLYDDDSFSSTFEFSGISLEDISLDLTGLDPVTLLGGLSAAAGAIPASGTALDLLFSVYDSFGIILDWPAEAIDPYDVVYDSNFGLPYGYLDVAVLAPFTDPYSQGLGASELELFLGSIDYASAAAGLNIQISATKSAVPDSGATALFALAGLGCLIAFRRRR